MSDGAARKLGRPSLRSSYARVHADDCDQLLESDDKTLRDIYSERTHTRLQKRLLACTAVLLGSLTLLPLLLPALFSTAEPDALALFFTGPHWSTVNVESADPQLPPYTPESLLAQRTIPPDCAEQWIADHQLCSSLHGQLGESTQRSLSIVWTWVNGTSTVLGEWRKALVMNKGLPEPRVPAELYEDSSGTTVGTPPAVRRPKRPLAVPAKVTKQKDAGDADYHFRSHNELLFSLRSSLEIPESLVRSRMLFSADLPTSQPTTRIGQRPTWLRPDAPIDIHHHWSAFRTRVGSPASEWRDRSVPSFNSLAIESQLAHLPTAETILYMNDDSLITSNVSSGDLATPLYGPVLRLQSDLLVESRAVPKPTDDLEGEWASLRYTNWLLDQRFGERSRPYAAHISKVFVRPLLLEMEAIWGDAVAETALSRFRGRRADVHMSYLAMHYLIEKHREVLLWSFTFGRRLSRDATLELLRGAVAPGFDAYNTTLNIAWPNRTTLHDIDRQLSLAGLAVPRSTKPQFCSADGFAVIELDPHRNLPRPVGGGGGMGGVRPPERTKAGFHMWPEYQRRGGRGPSAYAIDVEVCFPTSLAWTPSAVMRHIAFEQPRCGDGVIVALLVLSGARGLEAFLPPKTSASYDTMSVNPPVPGGVSATWREAEYSAPSSRLDVVRLLQRYSYMIGNSHSRFISVRGTGMLREMLDSVSKARSTLEPPLFTVLNDDIRSSRNNKAVDRILLRWFESVWPVQAEWEFPKLSKQDVFG